MPDPLIQIEDGRFMSVSELIELRRGIYETQLSKLGLSVQLARRLWTRESDLLDITANLILKTRSRPLRTQQDLRVYFFDNCSSATEVFSSTMALSNIATLNYMTELRDQGLIATSDDKLEHLAYVMEATKHLILERLLRTDEGVPIYIINGDKTNEQAA
jgi:hypothetical protein